jgi:hypothetical protein
MNDAVFFWYNFSGFTNVKFWGILVKKLAYIYDFGLAKICKGRISTVTKDFKG